MTKNQVNQLNFQNILTNLFFLGWISGLGFSDDVLVWAEVASYNIGKVGHW